LKLQQFFIWIYWNVFCTYQLFRHFGDDQKIETCLKEERRYMTEGRRKKDEMVGLELANGRV
jgi:hypothetical protein